MFYHAILAFAICISLIKAYVNHDAFYLVNAIMLLFFSFYSTYLNNRK